MSNNYYDIGKLSFVLIKFITINCYKFYFIQNFVDKGMTQFDCANTKYINLECFVHIKL